MQTTELEGRVGGKEERKTAHFGPSVNNNDPDWVSNGKQTARKCFQEGRKTKRVRGERANLKGLVLGCIEDKILSDV